MEQEAVHYSILSDEMAIGFKENRGSVAVPQKIARNQKSATRSGEAFVKRCGVQKGPDGITAMAHREFSFWR